MLKLECPVVADKPARLETMRKSAASSMFK